MDFELKIVDKFCNLTFSKTKQELTRKFSFAFLNNLFSFVQNNLYSQSSDQSRIDLIRIY